MNKMFKIIFEYNDANEEYALEGAWATKVEDHYKLDNILFYAPEYSLGDIVSAEERNKELYVTGLIKESGHSTVRILFNNKKDVQITRNKLIQLGCESEVSNIPKLISVDIPRSVDYFKSVRPFLEKGVEKDLWGFEEACIAHHNSIE
jgi:Domain of unknown function (DUF4265)